MNEINTALDKLLKVNINIGQTARSQGSISHNYIRDVLKGKSSTNPLFPRLVDGDFLSGSYARGTKLKPLDDIDVMVVIDGAGLHVVNSGLVQNIGVRGSEKHDNPILQHIGVDSLLSSAKVMSLFQKALSETHPNSKIRNDEQAVNVWLESYGLGIDVVPCFHLIPQSGTRDYYFIPEGNGGTGWKTTNPKIDEEISSTLHERHDKKLKKVIRLVKYWNTVSNNGNLKSYHIETLAWHIFDKRTEVIRSLEDGLIAFFVGADEFLAIACADKTALGGPVDHYLSETARANSRQKVREVFGLLSDTYVTHENDPALRKRVWQTIFSNKLSFA